MGRCLQPNPNVKLLAKTARSLLEGHEDLHRQVEELGNVVSHANMACCCTRLQLCHGEEGVRECRCVANCTENHTLELATGLKTLEEVVERANTLFMGMEEVASNFLLGLADVSQHLMDRVLVTGDHCYTNQVTEAVNLTRQMYAKFRTVCVWLDAMPTE